MDIIALTQNLQAFFMNDLEKSTIPELTELLKKGKKGIDKASWDAALDRLAKEVNSNRKALDNLFKDDADGQHILDEIEEHTDKEEDLQELSRHLLRYRTQLNGVKSHGKGGQMEEALSTISVKIGKKSYDLLVAKTEEEKEKGLQDVEEMDAHEGMLFDYRDDIQDECIFWMKDTTIALDIIFVDETNEVISVQKGEPLSEEYIVEEDVAMVIEVNAGSGIKAGDKVILPDDFGTNYSGLEPNKMYVIGSDGTPQAELQGNERIFSRKSTRVILRKAKKAYMSKQDADYKALARYVFNELDAQDGRDPEYVKSRT